MCTHIHSGQEVGDLILLCGPFEFQYSQYVNPSDFITGFDFLQLVIEQRMNYYSKSMLQFVNFKK